MNAPRDLRAVLRNADPAATGDLTPADRARMKAAVLRAASEPRSRWPRTLLLELAAGTAAVLLAVFAGGRFAQLGSKHQTTALPTVVQTAAPTQAPKIEPEAPSSAGGPRILPAVIRRPARLRPTSPSEAAQAATRILFTAPEGTRILWFVGPPPASEERS